MAARVLIVDDSALMRRMMRSFLSADPDLTVVAEAADTVTARRLIKEHDPDVVTLDVEMPGMNGIEFLRKIMALRPMPVIMVSTLTARGTDTTLAALEIGAVDVVHKPGEALPLAAFGKVLREKVRLAAGIRYGRKAAGAIAPAPPAPRWTPSFIAIGASTGGVSAATDVLRALPATGPPVLLVQHMPEGFTARFAARLDGQLALDVREARDGEVLRPGVVRIAPGASHMGVDGHAGALKTTIASGEEVSGHRPSVDYLFAALARTGARGLAVVLTGMGRDGADGVAALTDAGAHCIAQDEASSVVFGMPRAAIETGKVHHVLPLPEIGPRLCTLSKPNSPHSLRAS
ncbi:MAG: chemotaxis response regulator protein-glutamate methylesterase [Pseudomonadota bacterium]